MARDSIQSHLKTGAACCLPLVQKEGTSEVLQGSPDMTQNMACRGMSASPVTPALCSGHKQEETEKLVMEARSAAVVGSLNPGLPSHTLPQKHTKNINRIKAVAQLAECLPGMHKAWLHLYNYINNPSTQERQAGQRGEGHDR